MGMPLEVFRFTDNLGPLRKGAFSFEKHIEEPVAGEGGFRDMTVVEVRGNTEVHQRGVRDGPPVMVQVIKDTVEIILWGLAQDWVF